MKKNILFVFGTRPEVIKIFPIIRKLKEYSDYYNVILCNTGQQKELTEQALSMFQLDVDYNLSVMTENQSLETTQNKIIEKLKNIFLQKTYQAVIVQGDTLSAFCGALVAFYNHVKVLHVEAGLRTDNIEEPFPEEAYRQMISRIATLHFAPSLQAKENLLKENIDEKNIFVCGNTVIDALKIIIKMYSKECKNKFFLKGINIKSKIVLITAHRRENQNEKLQHILTAIKNLALDFPSYNFIWPVHPNPNIRNIVYEKLSNVKNIILSAPPLIMMNLYTLCKKQISL